MNNLNRSSSIKVLNSLKSYNSNRFISNKVINKSIINNNNNNNNNYSKREIFTKINQSELGVRYTFGRIGKKSLSAGLRLMLPLIHTITVFDIRPHNQIISSQSLVTNDSFVVDLNTLVEYKVIDPIKLVGETPDHDKSIKDIIQVQLVQIIPTVTLDQLINERQSINNDIQLQVQEKVESLGLQLVSINITDVIFSTETQNAISKKAQANLLKEARMISAKAELESSHIILEAAKELEKSPLAMRIREIEAMQDIAKEPSKSFIFAPSNLFESISKK